MINIINQYDLFNLRSTFHNLDWQLSHFQVSSSYCYKFHLTVEHFNHYLYFIIIDYDNKYFLKDLHLYFKDPIFLLLMNLFLLKDIRISTCFVQPIFLVKSIIFTLMRIMSVFLIIKYSFHFVNFLFVNKIFNFIKLYSQYIKEFNLFFQMIVSI